MPDLQISDLPLGNQTDLTAEAELAADVGPSHATKKYSYTQLAQALTLRGSVAEALQYLQASARIFKGYYSSTQPTDPSLKIGYLWYQGSNPDMPLGFPWTGANLKRWDGSTWVAAGASYTPDAWDGWADLNNGQGYYWFNGAWQVDDVNADGVTIEILSGGKLAVKDGGIDSAKLSTAVADLVNGALQRSGGTMAGALKVITPSDDTDAASKKYVDDGLGTKQNKITSVATAEKDYLWKAPVAAGEQPGLVELSTLATKSALDDVAEDLSDHIEDTGNPHDVSLQQAATQQGAVNTTLPGEVYKDTVKAANKLLSQVEVDARIATYVQGNPLYMGQLKYGADTVASMNAITGMSENDLCGVQETQLSYKYGHLITNGGLGYTVGDIVETDAPGVFAEVTGTGTDGVIIEVVSSSESTATGSGSGASIAADMTWNTRMHGQDAVGQYYDLVHWYGTWHGASFAGEVSARITCKDAVTPVWDLIVHVDLLADGEVADEKMADTITDDTETEPDFSDTAPKGFALFKQMVWRGINWLKAKKLSIQQNAADVGKAMVIGGDGKLAPGVSGKVDSVNGIRPDTDKDVKTDYAYDNYNDYLADRANVPANAHVMIKNEFKDVYTGYMLVPDEINLEPTNRISDNHGMWIADRAGYIRCVIMADNAGGTGWLDSGISINGVDVAKQQFPNIPIRFFPPPILVKAGDRIVIWINPQNTTSLSNVSVACYFIPPVIVPIPQSRIVVQLGSDYSLTEQPVLINDGGTIRQKQDVDGKPIWCRTFTGNLTIPAGTWDYPILIPSGIEAVLGQDGWWNTGGGSRMPVEICENKKGVDDSVRCFFVLRKDADQSMIISTYSDVVRTNAPYRVYVEYTKV